MISLAEHPALERWCAENIDSAQSGDALLAIVDGLIGNEREACARVAEHACLVPPDGGSPTEIEVEMCARAARFIRARSEPPLRL
jgi:S-adenosylmethionine hydrolase